MVTRSILGGLVVCAITAHAIPDVQYRVVDLGSLGGFNSTAFAINDSGDVAGISEISDSSFHAILLTATGLIDLGTVAGSAQSFGLAINNDSVVVGTSYNLGSLTIDAFRAAAMSPTVPLGSFSARGINDLGDVVGTARVQGLDGWISRRACIYQSGVLTELAPLSGDTTHALGINNAGTIVGSATLSTQFQPHAVMWTNGIPVDLGTLGGTQSEAKSVNDAGIVVGHATLGNGVPRACRFVVGAGGGVTRTNLGTLDGANTSYANAINEAGEIVGVSDSRAFIYRDTDGMLDLNDLIDPLSEWELRVAHDINTRGMIVGAGLFGGLPHGFILIPVSCASDLNADGTVDVDDLNAILSVFGTSVGIGDPRDIANNDGQIDVDDLNIILANFGATCP